MNCVNTGYDLNAWVIHYQTHEKQRELCNLDLSWYKSVVCSYVVPYRSAIILKAKYNLDLTNTIHDDVIKWKHFPRNWPFVRGIHRSPVNSPHKGQWRGAFMFSLICVWINHWVNNREAGDLRRYRAHFVVIVMKRRGYHITRVVVLNQIKAWCIGTLISCGLGPQWHQSLRHEHT